MYFIGTKAVTSAASKPIISQETCCQNSFAPCACTLAEYTIGRPSAISPSIASRKTIGQVRTLINPCRPWAACSSTDHTGSEFISDIITSPSFSVNFHPFSSGLVKTKRKISQVGCNSQEKPACSNNVTARCRALRPGSAKKNLPPGVR